MDALVVVDMQPRFTAAKDPHIIKNVIALCERAIDQQRPIILLEYGSKDGTPHCHTDPSILHVIYDYNWCQIMRKWDDDGSEEVISACRALQLIEFNFVVCGVNARACVRKTVVGLHDRLPQARIKVIKSACNCTISQPQSPDMFKWADNIENVVLAA